jgi:outer membrane protein TolC
MQPATEKDVGEGKKLHSSARFVIYSLAPTTRTTAPFANRLMKEMSKILLKPRCGCLRFLVFTALVLGLVHRDAQAQISDSYRGSAVQQKATPGELPLSLDDAMQLGLKNNLGAILQNTNVKSEGGSKLQQLQALLPTVTGTAQAAVSQVNLQAEGLKIPGFPAVIGPFGYTDFRATLNQTLLNVSSLQSYLASKHNFEASKLSARDSQDLVVLTVGNAYLLCLADATRILSLDAQVQTSKVSLDQAIQNHQNGVSPRIDELRARVDYQTQEQSLIAATAQEKKDRIALARAIGLPLDQEFKLTDQVPYSQFDAPTMEAAMAEAVKNRSDLKAAQQQVTAAEKTLSAAHAERYPELTAEVDYGAIGVNPGNSYATLNATGKLSGPIFEEGKLRGDARIADAQLQQARAQLNNLEGQIRADVKDAILDIQSSEQLVSVARSNVDLASEALQDAQDRFQAGVSDNLAVSQAQSSVAQANDRYVSSLYQLNVAKLSLARAVGAARTQYKTYLGGQ